MIKVVEVTEKNEIQYLDQIATLEEIALAAMEKEKRTGQLFITGKEDVSEYIHSEDNTVMVAIDENGEVISAAYITQGQKPFTYNDITKYFKYGEQYKKYVKSQYPSDQEFREDLLKMYRIKREAFEDAKRRILEEYPEVRSIHEFLEIELKKNAFDETSKLRQKLNQYMSEYIAENYDDETLRKYEQFYWFTSDDIISEFGMQIDKQYEGIREYEEILRYSQLTIYEPPSFDIEEYYSANTQNSIEIDTYITSPNSRNAGIARAIVYEGVKKHIDKHFENPNNSEIFLCSTLHRDNLSSKYVSEFFGLTDSLYVKRRQTRDREVHICRIPREHAMEYKAAMSDKLAVLYGYNPSGKRIFNSTRMKVLQEQLQYEKAEFARLQTASSEKNRSFSGLNIKFISSKYNKIQELIRQINELENGKNEYNGGDINE